MIHCDLGSSESFHLYEWNPAQSPWSWHLEHRVNSTYVLCPRKKELALCNNLQPQALIRGFGNFISLRIHRSTPDYGQFRHHRTDQMGCWNCKQGTRSKSGAKSPCSSVSIPSSRVASRSSKPHPSTSISPCSSSKLPLATCTCRLCARPCS
jgi:hypothetical protein